MSGHLDVLITFASGVAAQQSTTKMCCNFKIEAEFIATLKARFSRDEEVCVGALF